MKIGAVIESRMGSSRLPGKIMLPVLGRPALSHLVERIRRSSHVTDIVVATTVRPSDLVLEDLARREGVLCHRGSEEDVLLRVYEAVERFGLDIVVEVTSDCPLCDPAVVDTAVSLFLEGGRDYVSNVIKRSYPRGLDVQVFSRDALRRCHESTTDPADREHVSLYMYEHPEHFRLGNFCAPAGLEMPGQRATLDTAEDYFVIRAVFEALYPAKPDFGYADIHAFLTAHPEVAGMNAQIDQKAARGYDITLKARQALGLA